MKTRHMVMAAGLAIAAGLTIFGDKSPSGSIAEPVKRSPASAPQPDIAGRRFSGNTSDKASQEIAILPLIPRAKLIDHAQDKAPTDSLFAQHTWTPPPPPPKLPPARPMAPPLPFSYLGKKIEAGKWEAYLARGEQTFIVREQTVIESTYRVDAIKPPTLFLTYLPLNQSQTLTIGGTD